MTSHRKGDTPHPSILGIPPEMMETVAAYLPTLSDIASLRLACREINDKVSREFARKTFTTVGVLAYWPESIGRLEEVSRHPVFAKAITNIVLYTQILLSEDSEATWREAMYRDTIRQGYSISEALILNGEKRKLRKQMRVDQQSFIGAEGPQKILARILENLKAQNGAAVGIEIRCDPWEESYPKSRLNATKRVFDREAIMGSWDRLQGSWLGDGLAEAIFQSAYPISNLSVENEMAAINPKVFVQAAEDARDNDSAIVRSLRSLSVQTCSCRIFNESSSYVHDILTLLLYTPNLEHLELHGLNQTASFTAQVATTTFLPSLRSVELSIDLLTPDQAVEFCKRHIQTLEKAIIVPWCFKEMGFDIATAKEWIVERVGGDKLIVESSEIIDLGSDSGLEREMTRETCTEALYSLL